MIKSSPTGIVTFLYKCDTLPGLPVYACGGGVAALSLVIYAARVPLNPLVAPVSQTHWFLVAEPGVLAVQPLAANVVPLSKPPLVAGLIIVV